MGGAVEGCRRSLQLRRHPRHHQKSLNHGLLEPHNDVYGTCLHAPVLEDWFSIHTSLSPLLPAHSSCPNSKLSSF